MARCSDLHPSRDGCLKWHTECGTGYAARLKTAPMRFFPSREMCQTIVPEGGKFATFGECEDLPISGKNSLTGLPSLSEKRLTQSRVRRWNILLMVEWGVCSHLLRRRHPRDRFLLETRNIPIDRRFQDTVSTWTKNFIESLNAKDSIKYQFQDDTFKIPFYNIWKAGHRKRLARGLVLIENERTIFLSEKRRYWKTSDFRTKFPPRLAVPLHNGEYVNSNTCLSVCPQNQFYHQNHTPDHALFFTHSRNVPIDRRSQVNLTF